MGAGVVHHVAFRTPDDDEPAAWLAEIRRLGGRLMLPPWLERRRAEIERVLPKVRLPKWSSSSVSA